MSWRMGGVGTREFFVCEGNGEVNVIFRIGQVLVRKELDSRHQMLDSPEHQDASRDRQSHLVKFATCTLLGAALTWWNGQIRTLGPDAYSNTMVRNQKKKTTSIGPQGEIKN
ncbi:hypothetical protein Tco_0093336 [Tanacetum coccineum]